MNIALVCIAKNEGNYINEWVDYHLKLDFNRIFIYENDWNSNLSNPNVTTIPISGTVKQVQSYNDFISNYKQEYDWAMFLDVDEFLVLKKHKNVLDFIEDYKNETAVGINWVLFGDNHQKLGKEYSVLKRFTKRQISVNHHIKTIVNLKKCSYMKVHNHEGSCVDTNFKKIDKTPLNPSGPINIAQINHYFVKTKEEFMLKISRGRADMNETRNLSDFDSHNFNEIDDYTARDFFYDSKNEL